MWQRRFGEKNVLGLCVVSLSLAFLAADVLGQNEFGQDPARHRTGTYHIIRFNDARDRPKFEERETNRGFEVRRPHFTVVARTGREDARLAAAEFAEAWSESLRLLEPWTDIPTHPDFGLGAAEITISAEPPRPLDRNQPATALTVIGTQMIVTLNLSDEKTSLNEQLPNLRMSAMYSLLHAAHFDRNLPTWVRDGLAVYVAEKREEQLGIQRPADQPLRPLDSDYWTRQRVGKNELEERPAADFEKPAQVRFLLEAFDCRFAPQFFAALQTTAEQTPTRYNTSANRRDLEPIAGTPIDQLMERLQPQFAKWRKEPLADYPLFKTNSDNPDLALSQRELAFTLKLIRRFQNNQPALPGDVAAPQSSTVKVQEFRRPERATNEAKLAVADAAAAPTNLNRLFDRLLENDSTWATLDVDGRVLLSSDRERLQQIQNWATTRVASTMRDQRPSLRTGLPNGATLEAWLEENREQPARPIVRFALHRAGQ